MLLVVPRINRVKIRQTIKTLEQEEIRNDPNLRGERLVSNTATRQRKFCNLFKHCSSKFITGRCREGVLETARDGRRLNRCDSLYRLEFTQITIDRFTVCQGLLLLTEFIEAFLYDIKSTSRGSRIQSHE